MKKLLFLLIIFCTASSVSAQTVNNNQVDENGRRQGIWRLHDRANDMDIVMKFINGVANDSILFYRNDSLKFIYVHLEGDKIAYKIPDHETPCEGIVPSSQTTAQTMYCDPTPATKNKIDGFILYEIMPAYYGGESAMWEYIQNSASAAPPNQKGQVKLSFTLDGIGKTKDIEILESDNKKLNAFCIRLVEQMPRWQPGFQGGRIVQVKFTLPLNFK